MCHHNGKPKQSAKDNMLEVPLCFLAVRRRLCRACLGGNEGAAAAEEEAVAGRAARGRMRAQAFTIPAPGNESDNSE